MEEEYEYELPIVPIVIGLVSAAAGAFGIKKYLNRKARKEARRRAVEREMDYVCRPGEDRLQKLMQDESVSYDEFLREKAMEQAFVDIIRDGYLDEL